MTAFMRMNETARVAVTAVMKSKQPVLVVTAVVTDEDAYTTVRLLLFDEIKNIGCAVEGMYSLHCHFVS